MEPIRIIGDIIFSVKFTKTSKDLFTEVFQKWNDPEYIFKYTDKYKGFIVNNIHFNGYTLQQVKESIIDETMKFRPMFYQLIENSQNNVYPTLEDRFYVLSKYRQPPDVRKKMYGHEQDSDKMVSVLRLYAIRIPSSTTEELPAYLIIGGAIKFSDNMKQMRDTNTILKRFDTVQEWLRENKITNKEALIHYIEHHEQSND